MWSMSSKDVTSPDTGTAYGYSSQHKCISTSTNPFWPLVESQALRPFAMTHSDSLLFEHCRRVLPPPSFEYLLPVDFTIHCCIAQML